MQNGGAPGIQGQVVGNDVNRLFQSAVIQYQNGQVGEAEISCRQVLRLQPKHPNCCHLLGLIRYKARDLKEAARLLETAQRLLPRMAEVHLHLALVLFDMRQYPRALIRINEALSLQPDHAESLLHRGKILDALDRFEDAEASFRDALAVQPDFLLARINLGSVLRRLERYEEAIESCRIAMTLSPESGPVHNNLANMLMENGQLDEAVEMYRKALSLDPSLKQAHSNLGEVLQQQGHFSAAADSLFQADTVYSRSRALECLAQAGDWKQLDDKMAEAARVEPNNLRMAALGAYIAERREVENPFPFCPDAFNYVSIQADLGGVKDCEKLLAKLDSMVAKCEKRWEPKGATTCNGYQSVGNLFENSSDIIAKLERIILREIAAYREAHDGDQCTFIQDWPEKSHINGWFVRLLDGGHQAPHIHPRGWLSGVLYLQVPDSGGTEDGSIEFGLWGNNYPEIGAEKGPTLLHNSTAGELVLFPSTLYHRTIPFSSDTHRLCIAFDLIPE